MDNFNAYKDIQTRTGEEIYIGVVELVRIGKSTSIKQFIEPLVLLAMENESLHNSNRDELSQNAAGKAVMIMKPKFVPREAARISLANDTEAKTGVTDCVGLMTDGTTGHMGNGKKRLVKTPWFNYDIPFTQAAEIGTRKVINDRSTIGIVVTTDGAVEGIRRPGYIIAEEQTVDELKKLGRPLVVLLNSTKPYSDEVARLAKEVSELYGVSVLPVNCEQLKKGDIFHILERILKEFLATEMDFHIPKWLEILSSIHWFKIQVIQTARNVIQKVTHVKDISGELKRQCTDTTRPMNMKNMQMVDGRVGVQVDMDGDYYYQVLSDYAGLPTEGEYQLVQTLDSLINMQKGYEEVQSALTQMRLERYGVVTPGCPEITLDEPQAMRHGNEYDVEMKAEAPSINLIKTHIEMEVTPIMGSEQQIQDLIAYVEENARESGDGIWNTNTFGKPIKQIVGDSTQAGTSQMTKGCQLKLQGILQKTISDGNDGMICITI